MCEPSEPSHEMTPLAAVLWTVGMLAILVLAGAAGGLIVTLLSK